MPKTSPLPHERQDNSKEWSEKYGEFTTIDDELKQRWLETHYQVHTDELGEKDKDGSSK